MARVRSSHRKTIELALTVSFVGCLCTPPLGILTHFPAFLSTEDALVRRPFREVARESLFLQKHLVRWNALIRVGVLGSSTSPRVVLGREGWLFYGNEVRDSVARPAANDARVAAWSRDVAAAGDYCRIRGIPYTVLVGPNKATIYPEFLPGWVHTDGRETRMDLFLDALRSLPSPPSAPDVRPLLLRAKKRGQLYFRTDTHWNAFGAGLALEPVIAFLGERMNDLDPILVPPAPEFQDLWLQTDLQHILGLEGGREAVPSMPDPSDRQASERLVGRRMIQLRAAPATVGFETTCSRGPAGTLLVFHDSFGRAMVDPLARRFQRVVFVNSPTFLPDVADEVRPSAVIQMLVERRLFQEDPGSTAVE